MQEYMIKFNRLLTSKNVDSINIEKALLKILSSLKKLYISIMIHKNFNKIVFLELKTQQELSHTWCYSTNISNIKKLRKGVCPLKTE
ncbi:hypothetical protein NW062_05870 [Mycoplasmopsis cynos]|nr:hypothetical protein NW062_05870 [Mycoplasmopsis cynos]